MIDINIHNELAWPFTLMLSWFAGEYVHRHFNVPRICIYGLIGFLSANAQLGILPADNNETMLLLANIAFSLILFETGYRINLHWFRINYWMSLGGLLEGVLTFSIVYYLLTAFDIATTTAMLLSALVMATSPAAVMRVINEQRSSGQVTERTIHLSALSCVIAVLSFKTILGLYVFQTSGNLWQAFYNNFMIVIVSALIGLAAGMLMPAILRHLGNASRDGTIPFAMTVIFLAMLTHALKLSPIIAALTFGVIARHRRVSLSQTRRNFGAIGDILSILLFTFITSTLQWQHVQAWYGLAIWIVVARLATKVISASAFAYLSGITWKKGVLTGIAMSPVSVFVILTMEQTRYLGVDLTDQLVVLAAVILILDLLGPLLTQYALSWAGESPDVKEQQHAT